LDRWQVNLRENGCRPSLTGDLSVDIVDGEVCTDPLPDITVFSPPDIIRD